MKVYQITDPKFREYGKVLKGYDVQPILNVLNTKTPLPEGTAYVAEEPEIQSLPVAQEIAPTLFGGLPVQFGWCNGHNTKLNCLEYHRNSEFNLGTEDFVLLLAKEKELDGNYHLDTSKVKAFLVPAGVLVEIYADTLHYAPCHVDPAKGFRVLVALPKGTNVGRTVAEGKSAEDKLLRATNKWLLAHAESPEAGEGAYIGLDGDNCDLKS